MQLNPNAAVFVPASLAIATAAPAPAQQIVPAPLTPALPTPLTPTESGGDIFLTPPKLTYAEGCSLADLCDYLDAQEEEEAEFVDAWAEVPPTLPIFGPITEQDDFIIRFFDWVPAFHYAPRTQTSPKKIPRSHRRENEFARLLSHATEYDRLQQIADEKLAAAKLAQWESYRAHIVHENKKGTISAQDKAAFKQFTFAIGFNESTDSVTTVTVSWGAYKNGLTKRTGAKRAAYKNSLKYNATQSRIINEWRDELNDYYDEPLSNVEVVDTILGLKFEPAPIITYDDYWSLSQAARNKLTHADNGNICFASLYKDVVEFIPQLFTSSTDSFSSGEISISSFTTDASFVTAPPPFDDDNMIESLPLEAAPLADIFEERLKEVQQLLDDTIPLEYPVPGLKHPTLQFLSYLLRTLPKCYHASILRQFAHAFKVLRRKINCSRKRMSTLAKRLSLASTSTIRQLTNIHTSTLDIQISLQECVSTLSSGMLHGRSPDLLTASVGYDSSYIQRSNVPEGFFPIFINNKDDLCTIHAINVQLEPADRFEVGKFAANVPKMGYSPIDFIPKEYVSIYTDGALKFGKGNTPVNLLWSRNGPFGHYDALIPNDRLSQQLTNLNLYPNGRSSLITTGAKAGIILDCGKDSVPFDPRVVRVANLEEYIAHPDFVEPQITISAREDLYKSLSLESFVKNTFEASINYSQMRLVLYNNSNTFRNQRISSNGLAMTATFDADVREGTGYYPVSTMFDFSGVGHDIDRDEVVNSVVGITSAIEYKKLVENMTYWTPFPVGNVAQGLAKEVKNRLHQLTNRFTDANPQSHVALYSRLVAGYLHNSLALSPNINNVNGIVGAGAFAWANVPNANIAPNSSRLAAIDNARSAVIVSDLADMNAVVDPNWFKPDVSGNFPAYLIPTAPEFDTHLVSSYVTGGAAGAAVGDHNPYVVLANFWLPSLGMRAQSPYSAHAYSSFTRRYGLAPRVLFMARNESTFLNAANAAAIFSSHALQNPQSWMDAIILMLNTVGHSEDFFRAWHDVTARSFSFIGSEVRQLPTPPSLRFDYVSANIGADIESVAWNRLVAMRRCHILNATVEANAVNAAWNRHDNAVFTRFQTPHAGSIIRPTAAGVVAGHAAQFANALGIAPAGNEVLTNAIYNCPVGRVNDSLWYVRFANSPIGPNAPLCREQFRRTLASMTTAEMINLHSWCNDVTFRAANGVNHAVFNGLLWDTAATVAGRNPAAALPNDPAVRRDALASGYYIERHLSKPALGVHLQKTYSYPVGFHLMKSWQRGDNGYIADSDSLQLAALLSSLNHTNPDRSVPLLGGFLKYDNSENSFLKISMNLALSYRAIADGVSAYHNLSHSTLSLCDQSIASGAAELDFVLPQTTYSSLRMSRSDLTANYSSMLVTSCAKAGLPLFLTNEEAYQTINISFPSRRAYIYSTDDDFLGDGVPFMTVPKALNRHLAPISWRVLHPLAFEMVTGEGCRWGSSIRYDYTSIRGLVPNALHPWSGVNISEPAGSPYELISTLQQYLSTINLSMGVTLTFRYNNVNNDYSPRTVKNYNICPLTSYPYRLNDCFPHNVSQSQPTLLFISTPLRLLPSVEPQVTVNPDRTIGEAYIFSSVDNYYKSLPGYGEFPAISQQVGEYKPWTWSINSYVNNPDGEIYGRAGNQLPPGHFPPNVTTPTNEDGYGYYTLATPVCDYTAAAVENSYGLSVFQSTPYVIRNRPHREYSKGGKSAGSLIQPYNREPRAEFANGGWIDYSATAPGAAALNGITTAGCELFPSGNTCGIATHLINPAAANNYINGVNIHALNQSVATQFLSLVPIFINRCRRTVFSYALEYPIFSLYAQNSPTAVISPSSIPTVSGRSSSVSSTPSFIGPNVTAPPPSSLDTPHIALEDISFQVTKPDEVSPRFTGHSSSGNNFPAKPTITPTPPSLLAKLAAWFNTSKETTGELPTLQITETPKPFTPPVPVKATTPSNLINGTAPMPLAPIVTSRVPITTPVIQTPAPVPTAPAVSNELLLTIQQQLTELRATSAEEIAALRKSVNELTEDNKLLNDTIKDNNAKKLELEKDIKDLQTAKSSGFNDSQAYKDLVSSLKTFDQHQAESAPPKQSMFAGLVNGALKV